VELKRELDAARIRDGKFAPENSGRRTRLKTGELELELRLELEAC